MLVFTALSSSFRQARGPHDFAFHNYFVLVNGFGNGTEDNTDEFEELHVSEDTAVFDPASTTTTSAGQLSNHRSPRAATSHHDDGLLGDPTPAVHQCHVNLLQRQTQLESFETLLPPSEDREGRKKSRAQVSYSRGKAPTKHSLR